MKLKRKRLARSVAVSLLAVTLAGTALAQRIPASSSDSGRRAVVAIDQASINNNINNAQNTANWAGNVGSAAQRTADYATQLAQEASSRPSYGSVVASWYKAGQQGDWTASGLCLQGWNPYGASVYTGTAVVCPAGTGPYVIAAQQTPGGVGE